MLDVNLKWAETGTWLKTVGVGFESKTKRDQIEQRQFLVLNWTHKGWSEIMVWRGRPDQKDQRQVCSEGKTSEASTWLAVETCFGWGGGRVWISAAPACPGLPLPYLLFPRLLCPFLFSDACQQNSWCLMRDDL